MLSRDKKEKDKKEGQGVTQKKGETYETFLGGD